MRIRCVLNKNIVENSPHIFYKNISTALISSDMSVAQRSEHQTINLEDQGSSGSECQTVNLEDQGSSGSERQTVNLDDL